MVLALAGCGDSSPVDDAASTASDPPVETELPEELENVESESESSSPKDKPSKFKADVLLREATGDIVNFYILARDTKRQAEACADEAADEGDPDAYSGVLCYAFKSRKYYEVDDAVCWEHRGERTSDGDVVVEDGHSPATVQEIRDDVGCP